ncbi:MAG: hypothetical protein ACP5E3_15805 [Bacteroidales bacterium]
MKRSERIQRYLDGEMNEEELKDFRSDLQRDPELLEELDLHRTIEEGIKSRDELNFRKKLDESYEKYKDKHESKGRFRNKKVILLRVLSPIAAILLMALFFIIDRSPVTKEDIFDEYYSVMDFDFSSRSAVTDENDPNLAAGIRSFLEEDYQLSRVRLEEYVNADSENLVTASFFLGLSQLELGNYFEAVSNFKKVLEGEFSYYREHSKWYLALTYLKMDNLSEAEKIFTEFSQEKSIYQSKSSSILQKISKIK